MKEAILLHMLHACVLQWHHSLKWYLRSTSQSRKKKKKRFINSPKHFLENIQWLMGKIVHPHCFTSRFIPSFVPLQILKVKSLKEKNAPW